MSRHFLDRPAITPHSFAGDATGAILIEGALAFLLVAIIAMCLISIVDMLLTKERLNRAANQVAQVLATEPNLCDYNGPLYTGSGIAAQDLGNHMGYNYHTDFLSATIGFCMNGTSTQVWNQNGNSAGTIPNLWAGPLAEDMGHCGFAGGPALIQWQWPKCSGNYQQSVSVTYA